MTADSYSSILGYLSMVSGNDNNSWGDNANSAIFAILERGIAGSAAHAVTGGTLDLSGSPPPAGPSAALDFIQSFSGTLASNQIVVVPNLTKTWLVYNGCSGAYTLTFKTTSGSAGLAIPQGAFCVVACDGANNILVGLSTSLRDTQWLGASGTVAAPGLSFSAEAGSGWYRKSAGVFGFSVGGTEILEISATGVNITSGVLQVGGSQVIPAGTEEDYAGIELPSGGWLWEDGGTYSRTDPLYSALFGVITKTCTGTTHGTTTIDGLSADLRGKGLEGSYIECSGATLGTTIVSIAASSMVVSAAISGSGSGLTVRALPWGQGDGSTTFNVPDRRYRTIFGRDNMNNNPASRSSAFAGTKLVTTGGQESHTLTSAEMPAHTHTGTTGGQSADHVHTYNSYFPGDVNNNGGSAPPAGGNSPVPLRNTSGVSADHTHSFTSNSTGGGGSHNIMPVFGISNKIIKT